MRIIIAAMIGLAFLTGWMGRAFAQPAKDDDPIVMEQKQKQKDREEIDKKYKATLEKTRGSAPAAHVDPWANLRSDDSKPKR